MSALIVGFATGIVAVLVPGVVYVARVWKHATRELKRASDLHLDAQRLFANAQTLKADEERVAELAFMAWGLERRFDAAVREIARLERELKRTQRVPRLLWALAGVGAAVIVLALLRFAA